MSTVEERVAVLEAQVADLRERDRRTYDQANLALNEALQRQAHPAPAPGMREAIETATNARQESHEARELAAAAVQMATNAQEAHQQNVKLLNAVRETQSEHSATLAQHGERLDRIEGRLDRIDGKLGTVTAGVHDIQLMLRDLIQRDGGEHSAVS